MTTILRNASGPEIILRAKGMVGVNVTAKLNNNNYNGVVGSTGFVDIPLGDLGAYSVTVSKDEYTYTQTVNVYQYGITECWAMANKPFSDCTPEEIQAIARSGMAPKYWNLLDEHKITMRDGEEIVVIIADFNHDVGVDGETVLPLTLCMKDCFSTLQKINQTRTNVGGWEACTFRTGILPSILSNFPEDWQAIMTTCRKLTSIGNNKSDIQETEDILFLFAEAEVRDTLTYSFSGEGKKYPIFSDSNASRVKKVNGSAAIWWTRSPMRGYTNAVTAIPANGSTSDPNGWVDVNHAISVVFCVG